MRNGSLSESFRHAFAGLAHTMRTQRNARFHVAAAVAVLSVGIALRLSTTEFALLVLAIGMVFVVELANTSLEAVVDLAAPRIDPLARVAKDVAAGAVLVAAAIAVAVGGLVLVPHLLAVLVR